MTTMDEALAAGDSVLLNEQAALLRECRAALDSLLTQKPTLAGLLCGSTTLGNLRAELFSYRPSGVMNGTKANEEMNMIQGDMSGCTVLPDGSAFAVVSYPLPQDHWLYAPPCEEWDTERDTTADTPRPILPQEQRSAVVAAVRYAIRGATMCGKEPNFDPDALVLNAVYALCGPLTAKEGMNMATFEEKREGETPLEPRPCNLPPQPPPCTPLEARLLIALDRVLMHGKFPNPAAAHAYEAARQSSDEAHAEISARIRTTQDDGKAGEDSDSC